MNQLFNNKEQVLGFLQKAELVDKGITKDLISYFDNLKCERVPFYLTLEELEKILKWKLRNQFGRQKKKRELNTNENVIIITKAAFAILHEDKDVESILKLKILSTLSGVEIPVASSILTLCYPTQYSVIDFRNWRQVYQTEIQKTGYSAKEYIEYLKIIRYWSKEFNLTPQEIDLAIWQKDYEENRH